MTAKKEDSVHPMDSVRTKSAKGVGDPCTSVYLPVKTVTICVPVKRARPKQVAASPPFGADCSARRASFSRWTARLRCVAPPADSCTRVRPILQVARRVVLLVACGTLLGKRVCGPNARSGGRLDVLNWRMRAPDTIAREVCTRRDDPGGEASARAVLRDDVSPRWHKRGVIFVVYPDTVCHLRAPSVHGSRRASYGQNLIWFGLNPICLVSASIHSVSRCLSFRSKNPSPVCAGRGHWEKDGISPFTQHC